MKKLIKQLFPSGKRELLGNCLHLTAAHKWMPSVSHYSGLAVYNYHRVGNPDQCQQNPALISATQENFEQQVRLLKQTSDVIRIDDLKDVLNSSRGRYSLITFDDGYEDNYSLAFPVLKQAGVSATFFLTSGFLDRKATAWWDDIYLMFKYTGRQDWNSLTDLVAGDMPHDVPQYSREQIADLMIRYYWSLPQEQANTFLEQLSQFTGVFPQKASPGTQWMTWDMARLMRDGGMDFGAHTVSHPILTRINKDQLASEIQKSKSRIETELNLSIRTLSYPVGLMDCFNDQVIETLQANGIDFGFSFYGGTQPLGEYNSYDIPRMGVSPDINLKLFQAIVTLPNLFLRPKPPVLQVTTGQLPASILNANHDQENGDATSLLPADECEALHSV